MRTAIITTLVLALTACKPTTNKVIFSAGQVRDTLYRYQDGEGYFVAKGLVEKLSQQKVVKAKLLVRYLESGDSIVTELTSDNFYLTDTLYYGLRAEVYEPDHTTERIGKEPKQVTYLGELEVLYSNGELASYLDTICFTFIEPVKNDKMIGEVLNGMREGKWHEFNDRNRTDLSRSSTFLNGLRSGFDTIFKDQKPYIISTWKQGKKHGIYRTYYPNGVVNNEMLFQDGQAIEPMYFFSNKGKLIDSAFLFTDNPTESNTSSSSTP